MLSQSRTHGTGIRFLFIYNLTIAPIAPNVSSLLVPNVMLASLFFGDLWFNINNIFMKLESIDYTCHSSMFYVYLRFVLNFSPFMLHNKYNVYTHRCSLVHLNYSSCCVIFLPFVQGKSPKYLAPLDFTVGLLSWLHMPEFLHWHDVLVPCRSLKVAIE